jgi:pimeloyl-[acyl-carrier protein] methyl ester esterase
MDGTGQLFHDFIGFLPKTLQTVTVRYPTEQCLSYDNLDGFVRAACPVSSPFILFAESFSTPLAIKYAATNPANLIGVILCAGFATSPVRTWRRFFGSVFAPFVIGFPLSERSVKFWLVGQDAPSSLLTEVKSAIRSVHPKVLTSRLRAVLACDTRLELAQIVAPILYIQASQDRLVSASCLEEIHRIMPQITAAILDGPHLLVQRKPQRVAEVVAEFARHLL